MTRNDKLLLAAGILLVIFGLFLVLGSINNIADRKNTDSVAADVAVLLIAGVLPLVLGVWLVLHARRRASQRAFEARERIVLHLAGQHHGELTVPQVAEESDMTLEQAKEVLERLYRKSFTEVTLSDAGEMVYRFPVSR